MSIARCIDRVAFWRPAVVMAAVLGPLPAIQAPDGKAILATPHLTVYRTTTWDGKQLDRTVIHGPARPPAGFKLERRSVALPVPSKMAGTNSLTVPAYTWVFGCSAVSGAMIAAFYDRTTHPNIYTGPTNGGVMPLMPDASWPNWQDVSLTTYPSCPLIASKDGVDGHVGRGSIDDYWVQYDSAASDPYITGGWAQHAWGAAIGDYMKTSQSAYNHSDGSTTFYNYTDGRPLTPAEMESFGIATEDGTYGRKLFYEAKGYAVTTCYSQKTDNAVVGGFSFSQYKAEIDAGHPVMLNLAGHTVVGVGYDNAATTVYLHDTWDTAVHSMAWGTTYAGMVLQSVSIVRLLTCDLNDDGHVDLKDTARLARAFGTTSGDPLFKTAYDLNGDGTINEQDATILFNALD